MTTTARPPAAPPPRQKRMTLASVTSEQPKDPDRIFLYGVEKIGKSSWAADAPGVVFICSENGLAEIQPPPKRFPAVETWQDILDAIDALTAEPHDFKTLAVDSLDWAAHMLTDEVCARNRWNREQFDKYGRGFNVALEDWRRFVVALERLQTARGMEIILIAHAEAKRIDPPDVPAYFRYRPKMGGEAAPALLKEWSKSILFARHEMYVEESKEGFGRAKGISTGSRILHTRWTAAYDAGSRYTLPDPLPLSYAAYAEARDQGAYDVSKLRVEAEALIVAWSPDAAVAAKARKYVVDCGDNAAALVRAVDVLKTRVTEKAAQDGAAPTAAEGK